MGLVFNSVSEMLSYVQNACSDSMDIVGRTVETVLRDNVESSGAVDTGKLIGSIESEASGDGAIIKFADGAGHTSLWGSDKLKVPKDGAVYIPHWIDQGQTGTREAANFMDKTMNELEANKDHVDAMSDGLAMHGIKATR
ncbi:MAG: hypothetical protein ACRDA3_13030 [Peptostreptococcaceae bacterium]